MMLPSLAVYMCAQVLTRTPISVCPSSLPDDERLRFHLWVRVWMQWAKSTDWN